MNTPLPDMRHPSWSARSLSKVMLCVAVAIASTVALSAWAQPAGPRMHTGAHGGGPFGNPQRLERLLDMVKASDAQRAQIQQIMQAAAADLAAQGEARQALRKQAMAVLTAPTVDPAAAEQVRQQMLVQHDKGSRRMMAATLEVSRVLSPEQRAQWAEHMQHRARNHSVAPTSKPS